MKNENKCKLKEIQTHCETNQKNRIKHKGNIWKFNFLTFPADFLIPIIFSNLNYNCSNFFYVRNLQEQVKKAFCYQKLFWPFTVWINCSSDLKNFANSRPSASNFKSFFRSLEQFFLTVGQNNFGNKIPFLLCTYILNCNLQLCMYICYVSISAKGSDF